MNIATMVFVTNANDIVTELLNNPKMKEYKTLLLEIQSSLSQINKKVSRTFGSKYNDIICDICDDTNVYLEQLDNFYRRSLITDVQYSKIDMASKIIQLVIMVDHAQGLYSKTQVDKNAYKGYLNDLVTSTQRFLNKYDCMLGTHKHKPLFNKDTDFILDNMLSVVREKITEFGKKNSNK